MGLFNFLKKSNDDDKKDDSEKDMMLTLNQRQAPVKKDEAAPQRPQRPSEVQDTPQQTPPPKPPAPSSHAATSNTERSRDNMRDTQSISKKAKTLPQVSKLVLPTGGESEVGRALADNNVVEIIKGDKPTEEENNEGQIEAKQTYIPGEFIDIPVGVFLKHIPKEHLQPNITSLFDNSTTVRFPKDLILPILSQGVFAVVGSAFLARLPQGLAADNHASVKEIYKIPLTDILPLIPHEWFAVAGQDNSKMQIHALLLVVRNMHNGYGFTLRYVLICSNMKAHRFIYFTSITPNFSSKYLNTISAK